MPDHRAKMSLEFIHCDLAGSEVVLNMHSVLSMILSVFTRSTFSNRRVIP